MNAVTPLITARILADRAWVLGQMDRYIGDAMLAAFRQTWAARAAAKDDGSFKANESDINKYVDQTYKVLVVGDQSADVFTAGMNAWSDRSKGLTVKTKIQPDCGTLKTTGREDESGGRAATPPDCQAFRQSILDAAKERLGNSGQRTVRSRPCCDSTTRWARCWSTRRCAISLVSGNCAGPIPVANRWRHVCWSAFAPSAST